MMKRSITLLLSAFMLGMVACEGPAGPQGPAGPTGPPGTGEGGVGLENEVFEVEVNFSAEDDFFQAFELNPAIGQNDVVLIFMLWEVDGNTDIWRAIPQTIFLDEGILKYDYDFTRNDFAIFMEGNFDLTELGPVWTDGQVFRVVLVPGKALEVNGMPETYEELRGWINLDERPIRKVRIP